MIHLEVPYRVDGPETTDLRSGPCLRAFGVLNVGLFVYTWSRWIGSDSFRSAPTGSDTMAAWRLAGLRIFEVASAIVAVTMIWRFLVRPLLKERRLTFDGMFLIGGLVSWWMDPLVNYYNLEPQLSERRARRG